MACTPTRMVKLEIFYIYKNGVNLKCFYLILSVICVIICVIDVIIEGRLLLIVKGWTDCTPWGDSCRTVGCHYVK